MDGELFLFQNVLLRSKGCQRLLQVPLMDWEIVSVYGTPVARTRPTKGSPREREKCFNRERIRRMICLVFIADVFGKDITK